MLLQSARPEHAFVINSSQPKGKKRLITFPTDFLNFNVNFSNQDKYFLLCVTDFFPFTVLITFQVILCHQQLLRNMEVNPITLKRKFDKEDSDFKTATILCRGCWSAMHITDRGSPESKSVSLESTCFVVTRTEFRSKLSGSFWWKW